jgi:hypothetical protein
LPRTVSQLDASFVDDLGVDSFTLVDLTLDFEETFELEIPDDEAWYHEGSMAARPRHAARRAPRIVTDKPPRKFYTPTPSADERPTVAPPFDIEAYAREASAPESERRPRSKPSARRRSQLKEPEPDSASALLRTIDDAAGPRNTHTPNDDDDRVAAMRECFSHGDYVAALTMADIILAAQPNNPIALAFRANSRAALEDVHAFQLGPLDRVPVVVTQPERTGRQATDGGVAVVLSLMDGCAILQAIVDACGMPRLEVLRLLQDLNHRGIIAFE